jgi:hypothetical protein
VEDFRGDVALEETHRLVLALALGEAPGHVVAGGLLATQPDHQDDMQSSVGVTVTAAVESVPNGFSAGGIRWADPAELGECARTAAAGATPPTRRCPAGRMDSLRPGVARKAREGVRLRIRVFAERLTDLGVSGFGPRDWNLGRAA